jgi:hypothetical protein
MVIKLANAENAYANSLASSVPTFVHIDDAYADWCKTHHGLDINSRLVMVSTSIVTWFSRFCMRCKVTQGW